MIQQVDSGIQIDPVVRVRLWYALLLLTFGLFAVRVFYLQVIRYDYYKKAAQSDQLKQYTVPADRGTISAQLGDSTVPIVLNQKLYTLYADPTVIKNIDMCATKLQSIIGGSAADIVKKLATKNTRYVVIKKRLTTEQKSKITNLRLPGVGALVQDYRTYPQGNLAAQLLGFVNEDGDGKYGLEQGMNGSLKGIPGQLKAVTDINGIPLAANDKNLSTQPVPGKSLDLTIDIGMQAGLEKLLKSAQEKNQSKDVTAVIMDVHSGAIKAMANYPSFDPANYQNVEDSSVFQNAAVTAPIEPGSITKVFTTASALEHRAITPTSSFYDPGFWTIDGTRVADVEEDHSTGPQTVLSTLDKSLNTGATWMLMQMGGGVLNSTGRNALYESFRNHFMFGQSTGIEQGYEAGGFLPKPADTGRGINLTYANMSFGQAYSATAIQMVAALSSIVNGGTYYQPFLVSKSIDASGNSTPTIPKVVKPNAVSKQVSAEMVDLLRRNNANHIREGYGYLNFGENYSVGGKTGTAEVANPLGGYYADRVNGTYMGFVGGDAPQYAIVVYNLEPKKYNGFAGAGTGQPLFADIAHMLINNFGVSPKSK